MVAFSPLPALRDGIVETFTLEDVRSLCYDLGVAYDDLRGDTLSARTEALVEHLRARGRLPDLQQRVRQLRPRYDWRDVAEDTDAASPYKGLAFYDVADADLFFGRETLTADVVERLRHTRLLFVVGASGSGKSSLARAGVIATLKGRKPLARGVLPAGSAEWRYITVIPDRPLRNLAGALTTDSESVRAAATLIDDMLADSRSLDLYAQRLATPDGGARRVLIFVDQFEELFTARVDPAERGAFIANLLGATQDATDGPAIALVALRADFFGQCLAHEGLREALNRHQILIGGMTRDELRLSIEAPAHNAGYALEPQLVDALLDEMDEPGKLPLLSHALQETWKRRDRQRRALTLAGYESIGRLSGAIAHTAEDAYAELSASQQQIARRILLRLTALGDGTQDTRRRAALSELFPRDVETPAAPDASMTDTQRVLKALADARLVTTEQAYAEVTHEALIREWGRLRGWLNENREGLRTHRQLTDDAREWADLGQSTDVLYRGTKLLRTNEWAEKFPEEPNALELAFLKASVDAERRTQAEKEEQRSRELAQARALASEQKSRADSERQRNRVLLGAVSLLIVLLAGAIALAFYANRQSRLARARQLAVESITAPDLDLSLLLAAQARAASETAEDADNAVFRAVNSAAPELMAVLHGHSDDVWAVAFDPSNPDRFATGGEDRTVLLWSAAARRALSGTAPLRLERGSVYGLGFSADGRRLAVGTSDGLVTLFDVSGPAPVARGVITAHKGTVFSLAFNPADPNLLLTGGQDRAVRLWDLRGDAPVLASETISHAGWVWGVAFSPDGTRAGSVGQGQTSNVFWWDVSGRTLISRTAPSQHQTTVTSIAFAPNGRSAATGDTQGRVVSWNLAAMTPATTQASDGGFGFVWGLSYSGDSGLLAAGGNEGAVRVWDVRDPARASRVRGRLAGHRGGVLRLAFSPDPASKLLVSGGFENLIMLWDLSRPAVRVMLGGGPAALGGGLNSAGGAITFVDRGGAQIWDAAGAAESLPALPASLGAAVSAAGLAPASRAAGLGFADGQAAVFGGGREWTLVASTGISAAVDALAVSHDGKLIALAQCARTGADLRCEQTRIVQRNTSTGTPAGPDIVSDAGRVWSLAWSPDGQTLAAGACGRISLGNCAQGEIRAWSLRGAPRELRATPTQHANQITSLAFSPDGRWLASGSENATISLWRVHGQGQFRAVGVPLSRHDAGIIGLSFDPRGLSMRSLARDRTIAEWTLDPEALQQRACSVANRRLDPEEWDRLVPGEPYTPYCR